MQIKIRKLGTFPIVERFKFILKLCGLWSRDISSTYLLMLYNGYKVAFMFIFMLLYALTINTNIFFTDDVLEATDVLCMGLTVMALVGKSTNYGFFRRRIETLLRISEEFRLDSDQEVEFVNQQMVGFTKMCNFVYCFSNLAITFNSIAAIMSEEVRLPYVAWFPFDWKSNSTTYMLVCIYQIFGMFMGANLNMSIDLMSIYLMHVVSIKLETLGNRLRKLSEIKGKGQNQQADARKLIRCISVYQDTWK